MDKSFLEYAAKHLNVNKDFFKDFWDVFRNGVQHQASPKWRAGNGKERKPYKWAIDAKFKFIPTLGTNEKGEDVICINPWSFTEHYIHLFISDPALLNQAVHHSFGHVFDDSKVGNFQEAPYV